MSQAIYRNLVDSLQTKPVYDKLIDTRLTREQAINIADTLRDVENGVHAYAGSFQDSDYWCVRVKINL